MTARTEHNRQQYLKNREARLAAQKEYYAANKEARNEYNRLYAINNKEKIAQQRKEYRAANAEVRKQKMREWYEANRETAKQKAKEYRQVNKDKLAAWAKEYRAERKQKDPVYAMTIRIRSLINVKLYTKGYTKRSKTYEILGCDYAEFVAHIESQFSEGMTWENRNLWHLDHKIPVAHAKTEEEVLRLNHYTNIRPMWANDNLKKGARLLND